MLQLLVIFVSADGCYSFFGPFEIIKVINVVAPGQPGVEDFLFDTLSVLVGYVCSDSVHLASQREGLSLLSGHRQWYPRAKSDIEKVPI